MPTHITIVMVLWNSKIWGVRGGRVRGRRGTNGGQIERGEEGEALSGNNR